MDKAKPAPYSAGDLITYDNNKYVGVVLSVDSMGGPGSDLIRLISEDGTVQNIRGNQVSKRFDQRELKTKQRGRMRLCAVGWLRWLRSMELTR